MEDRRFIIILHKAGEEQAVNHKLNKNKLSLIFFILSALMFIVILVFITQALSYKPGKYTFKLAGYAGSFNRKAVKADKWPIEPYWMMHILGIFGMCILSKAGRR